MIIPLIALSLGLSSAPSSFQDGGAPGNAIQGTVPLPLKVRVVRADDGKPLPGSIVRLGARTAVTANDGDAALGGVPGGHAELRVTRAGFAEWTRSLDLALGRRELVLVELQPALPGALTGRVLRATDGTALPTARIELEPLNVPDGVRGTVHAAVDRKGAFSLMDLPAGRYGATIRAPGCLERRLDLEVPSGGVEIALELDTSPADLAVLVRDSESGAPLSGATVHLGEAWPLGAFGSATTNDNGRAGFTKVPLGTCNRAGEDGRVPALRRRATILVEAEGYAPRLLPVTLAPGVSIQVEMVRERDVPSPDRGDQPSSASPLELGAWQVCSVNHAGDRDHFRVRLADATRLVVELAEAPPLNVEAIVSRASGEQVFAYRRYLRQAFRFHVDLAPGEYLISLGHWGNSATSETPLRLRVSATVAPDANEPNDDRNAARRIIPGESVRGTILPVGDVDTFRFELEHAGVFHAVTRPMGLNRTVVVRDATGKELKTSSGYAGQTVQVEAHLPAGSYTVEVRNWGDSASSPEPWCLDTSIVEGDGVLDPVTLDGARPVLPRRELAPHAFVASTVAPRGDVDVHGVRVGSAGRLHVQVRAPFAYRVRVRDHSGAILADGARYPGQSLSLVAEASAASLLRVEVGPWAVDAWSPHPYALRTRFVPCGDDELAGRNDSLERATPALVGDVLRGNIAPVGDVDVHAIAVDHPGHLVVRGVLPGAMTVRILDTSGQELAVSSRYGKQTLTVAADVGRTGALVEVSCWGKGAVEGSYALKTTLEREDPADVGEPSRDAARALPDGEARSYAIVRAGDKDVFVHTTTSPGKWRLSWTCPINTTVQVFDDRTGAVLANKSRYGGQSGSVNLEAMGPTRYRIVVSGWGKNIRGAGTGLIMADAAGRAVTGAKIEVRPDPARPTEVEFVAGPLAGAAEATSIDIDMDGDGRADTRLTGGRGRVSLPAQGVYRATVRATGADGAVSVSHLWVDATGPRERSGVFLVIDDPTPGAMVETSSPARLRAVSYSGTPIARVTARIEGQPETLAVSRRAPYELQVPWQELGSGDHTLVFEATDARGTSAAVQREVTVSPYLDLGPADGAQLTGEAALVSWTSDGFGPARVRYRPSGTEEEWAESVGASSARPRVLLANLEFDTEYEWQALGAGEPSPVRTFTLVRGLAFGRRGYGATVARDYDQRIPISVRNHAEEPMRVELSCGAPAEGSLLLVGFVEEGSADEPFDLGPGEEREFVLALSAQDVITSRHEFAVLIRSDAGLADEALVTVDVVLPHVDLAWEDLGPTEDGLGRRMRVRNDGDGLTDLALSTSDPLMRLTPSVEHGLLAPGATLDVEARPRLYEGFSALAADVRATAVGTTSKAKAEVALPDNEELYQIAIAPYVAVLKNARENEAAAMGGELVAATDETIVRSFVGVLEDAAEAPPVDPDTFGPRPELMPPGEAVVVGEHVYSERPHVERAPDKEKLLGIGLDARALRWLHADPEEVDALLVAARNLAGAYLGPGLAPTGGTPEDMDGDGQPDRINVLDEAEGIRWTREGDPAGTQFLTADLGDDGQVDWAAFARPDGSYEETNLVGARLELDFKLPRHRWTHSPHDVDVFVNDLPVASLVDSIPEGGYSFRLPPAALAFTEDGRSDSARVKLETRHLRGGHYVVTSDFRLTAELLGTRTWTAGPDRDTARAQLEGTTGYVIGRPDHSVSSHELEVVGPVEPEAGTPLVLRVPLRSVGGAVARQVEVALLRGKAGAEPVELARQIVDGRGLPRWVSFNWTAAPGEHALRIVVDPDSRLDEASRANDVALTSLSVPGDDAPPTVVFSAPAAGAAPASGIVNVLLEAEDDVEIARLELSVDSGPWHELDPRRGAARVLLQPGQRRLVARATDGSGNRASTERALLVPGAAPTLTIDAPAKGTTLSEREVEVVLTVGTEAVVAAARAAGGPWTLLAVEDGVARGRVPVPFGSAAVEALVVDQRGA